MSILNVPIQINGDLNNINPPSSGLRDRELYITKDGYLYFGMDNAPHAAKVLWSPEARDIVGKWCNITNNDEEALFGHITVSGYEDRTEVIGDNAREIKKCYIRNFIATNFSLQSSDIIDLNKLVLNSNMYGKTLPKSGTDGQVFFLVAT